MGRTLRIERAGGWYHVTRRGNERRETFEMTGDRSHFLELLSGMAVAAGLKDYGTASSALRRFERLLTKAVEQAPWKLLCEKYKNQM